jgi:hypothetical protein
MSNKTNEAPRKQRDQAIHQGSESVTPKRGLSDSEAVDALQDVMSTHDHGPEGENTIGDRYDGNNADAMARLKESGTIEDATDAFVSLLSENAPEAEDAEAEDAPDSDPDTDEDGEAEDGDEAPKEYHDFTEQELDLKVKIMVKGEEQYLPLREIIQGGMRQAAFTKRTQELAAVRRQTEQARVQHQQAATEIATQLAVVESFMNTLPPESKAGLTQMRSVAEARVAALQAESMHAVLQSENAALLEALDVEESALPAIKRDLIRGAKQHYGLDDSSLDGVTDHRALLVLRDAIAYRAMKDKNPETLRSSRKRSPTLTPGSKNTPKQSRGAQQHKAAMRTLKSSGRMDDAAAALLAMGVE